MKSLRGQKGLLVPSQPGENQAELSVKNLSLRWGRVSALNNIDLLLRTGEILSLIGPKGAGKTSLINCITGAEAPLQGRITLNDKDITGQESHIIARLGVSRTYQETHIFPDMTILSNLMLARHLFCGYNIFQSCFFSSHARQEEVRNRGTVELLIDLFGMQHVRKSLAGSLTYGMKKRLEIARALAMEPKILILDDPFTGMNHGEIEYTKRLLLDLNELRNITMIIAEDDMSDAANMSNRVVVLDFGVKLAEGSPDFVRNHLKVTKIYPEPVIPG
jgi:branched-chain amino acid transport system ATP-binding protein